MASEASGVPKSGWLSSMFLLFIMRMCMSINFNAVRNIKITDYEWDADIKRCVYKGNGGTVYYYTVTIYLTDFFLPSLGGLMVDKCFGELRIIRLSGVLLFFSGVYVICIEAGHIICHPAAFLIGLVPSCLAIGLSAAAFVATPLKLSHGRFGSPTIGLTIYYASAATGELIGFLPSIVRHRVNLTPWIVSIAPLVYIAVSTLLRLDWTDYRRRVRHQLADGFLFPTRARLLRYFVLLAPMILLVSEIANVRGVMYGVEVQYYLNCNGTNCTHDTGAEVFLSYNVATVVVLVCIGIASFFGYLNSQEGRVHARFYAGATTLLVSRSAILAWHLWVAQQPSLPTEGVVLTVYAVASALDGIANGLALASGYELMYRIAPAHSKSFVLGLLFTVWAIGACTTGFTVLLLENFPRTAPIMKPVAGQANFLYVAYVVMVTEAVLLIMYYACFSTRLAQTMIELDDEDDDRNGDDTRSSMSVVTDGSEEADCMSNRIRFYS